MDGKQDSGRFNGLAGAEAPEPPSRLGPTDGIPSAEWRQGDDLSSFPWPLNGYAPGGYSGKCGACGDMIFGVAKRSRRCLSCAISTLVADHIAIDRAFAIRVWNEGKQRGLSDRGAMDEIKKQRQAAQGIVTEGGDGEAAPVSEAK